MFGHPWRCCFIIMALACCTLIVSPAFASTITVGDGSLSDWGITIIDGGNTTLGGTNYSALTPGNAVIGNGSTSGYPAQYDTNGGNTGSELIGTFTYRYHVEDTNDYTTSSYLLGPNHGGQNYDAEFLGVGVDSGNLAIGLLTGQRVDNGFAYFAPGDILITTTAGVFGIEVGGGAGGAGATNVTLGAAGTRYTLNNSTLLTTVATSLAGQTAGSVYRNATFITDPLVPLTPTQLTGGTLLGNAAAYSYKSVLNTHALIETLIPLSYFGGASILSVSWAPSCGNDVLYVKYPSNIPLPTPEPSSLVLFSLGGFGLVGLRRFRQQRQAA